MKYTTLKVAITRIRIGSTVVAVPAIVGATHRGTYCEAADKAGTKSAAVVTTAMPMLSLSWSRHSEGHTCNT
jgi:nitrate/nitrite transporter NarK